MIPVTTLLPHKTLNLSYRIEYLEERITNLCKSTAYLNNYIPDNPSNREYLARVNFVTAELGKTILLIQSNGDVKDQKELANKSITLVRQAMFWYKLILGTNLLFDKGHLILLLDMCLLIESDLTKELFT
ncbi:MAG: hypothetical protein OEX02_08695 [Cyclobacteriaceae bacterium]|nr:hypothetical protein [Cyclobacteriaceae bacterium]